MKTKKEAINVIKSICEENKDIDLYLAEEDMAGWKGKPSDKQLKDIGRISALSWAFKIKKKEVKNDI